MNDTSLPLPRPLRVPRRALVAAVPALAGALAVTLALVLLSSSGSGRPATPARFTAPGHAFSVVLPPGWRAVAPRELAALPSRPAAVLRRADHRGLVVVQRIAPIKADARSLTRSLTKRLRARLGDVKVAGARLVTLRRGTAYVYTFVRGATVQSVAVVASARATYAINAVVAGSAPDVARQVGEIVGSFS